MKLFQYCLPLNKSLDFAGSYFLHLENKEIKIGYLAEIFWVRDCL